jgi:hypothetical protein
MLRVPEINIIVLSIDEWLRSGYSMQVGAMTLAQLDPLIVILRDDYPSSQEAISIILHELSHIVDLATMGWTSDQFDYERSNIIVPWIMQQENWL